MCKSGNNRIESVRVYPQSLDDAMLIIRHVSYGKAVIINFDKTPYHIKEKIIDILRGWAFGKGAVLQYFGLSEFKLVIPI